MVITSLFVARDVSGEAEIFPFTSLRIKESNREGDKTLRNRVGKINRTLLAVPPACCVAANFIMRACT